MVLKLHDGACHRSHNFADQSSHFVDTVKSKAYTEEHQLGGPRLVMFL